MTEPLKLHTLGAATDKMGQAMGRAFRSEPNFIYMLPRTNRRERPLSWFFGRFVAKLGLEHGEVYTVQEGAGGAIWFGPGETPSARSSLRAGLLMMPLHFGLKGTERSAELGRYLAARREALTPQPHLYLVALGVDPERQGQGLGRALLRPGLERADSEAKVCYLETFLERTAEFYGGLGFEVVRQDALPGGPAFWCMRREPRGQVVKKLALR